MIEKLLVASHVTAKAVPEGSHLKRYRKIHVMHEAHAATRDFSANHLQSTKGETPSQSTHSKAGQLLAKHCSHRNELPFTR